MREAKPLFYTCCDVAGKGYLYDPCWYCQTKGKAVRSTDLDADHPWNRFRAVSRQQSALWARF